MNERLVQTLVEKDVLRFGEFTLKSGRKSPYFFNAGNIDSGNALSVTGEVYADIIKNNNIECDVIFGPAYKGIALAAATVQALAQKYTIDKRFAYDRKEPKEYGDLKDRLFVGNIREGDRILIVDDVTTTGKTKFDVIEKLNSLNMGLKVAGLIILFDRQEKGESVKSAVQELEEGGLRVYSALTAKDTFEFLKNKKFSDNVVVDETTYDNFRNYMNQYGV
jgi:orotate phosphoribosyltransferase